MIFWDTSAIVPLLTTQPASERARTLLRGDGSIVVWWGTYVDSLSALRRLEREGHLSSGAFRTCNAILDELALAWTEVTASTEVRVQAANMLATHPLRAADALQLGAALVWCGRPDGVAKFATFDERLAEAAVAERFTVLGSVE